MDELQHQCEKSFYRELYRLTDKGQSLVINETTQRVYLKKTLTIWQEDVLCYLRDHENLYVPHVQTFWPEPDGTLTLIEEYVQGKTLSELLMMQTVSHEKKLEILLEVMEGVSFLHQSKPPIIHRDIKPDNIMLTEGGVVKLIDYDAAKIYHGDREKDTVLLGTEGSAAPEQYGFAESDVRTDIYGLGVLIRTLFPGEALYEEIAQKATSLDPKDRYQNVGELRNAIRNTATGKRRPHSKKTRNAALVFALLGTFVAVFAIGMFLGKKQPGTHLQQEAENTPQTPVMEAAENPVSSAEAIVQNTMSARTENEEETSDTSDTKDAKLLDSGYMITYHNGFCHVCYAAKIENASQSYAVKNVYMDVTCRAGDGRVLKSDSTRIPFIAAGDTIYMADEMVSWKGEEADSVDISIRHDPDSTLLQEDSRVLYMEDFEISNVSVMEEFEGRKKYAGEITNNSGYDLNEATLVIVYRKNGKLVGGRQDRVKDLKNGAMRSFDSSALYQFDDYDEYEIYAVPWSRGSSTK